MRLTEFFSEICYPYKLAKKLLILTHWTSVSKKLLKVKSHKLEKAKKVYCTSCGRNTNKYT